MGIRTELHQTDRNKKMLKFSGIIIEYYDEIPNVLI